MNLLGFSNRFIKEGYNRSDLIPNVDKVKFLKLYCNLVDNREDNEFLTNIFIKGGISDQVTYENDNIYKSKNILNSTFNYIEICIKESNIIKINNNNGDNKNFDNGISFNTQSIASKMINYKDAYVLLHIECEISFDETDQGKKSIPKLLYLKNSFEIVKNLKVQLNNVTILNKSNANISSLIDLY